MEIGGWGVSPGPPKLHQTSPLPPDATRPRLNATPPRAPAPHPPPPPSRPRVTSGGGKDDAPNFLFSSPPPNPAPKVPGRFGSSLACGGVTRQGSKAKKAPIHPKTAGDETGETGTGQALAGGIFYYFFFIVFF